MRALGWMIFAAGCAGPFVEASPAAVKMAGVSVSFCGSSKLTLENVVKKIEPPSDLPTEVGGSGGLEAPEEARLCLSLENHSSEAVRIDRRQLQLKCPRERQQWIEDADPEEIIVRSGETKQLHVSFHYSPIDSGDEVAVLFDGALTVGKRALKAPPLPLKRR